MSLVVDAQWHMKPNLPLAMQLAKRDLSMLVCDAVNLEGAAMRFTAESVVLHPLIPSG